MPSVAHWEICFARHRIRFQAPSPSGGVGAQVAGGGDGRYSSNAEGSRLTPPPHPASTGA